MPENEAPNLAGFVVAEQMQLCLPSRPDWIEAAAEYLRQWAVLSGACDESRSGKLLIAFHEAISNAIIHGNLELSSELKERGDTSFAEALAQRASDPALAQRIVDIVMRYDGDRARWIITDQGQGFDYERWLKRQESDDPEADPEALLASGRGILLMRSFLDEIRYEQGGRRLILTLNRASGEEKRRAARRPLQEPLRVAPVRPDGTVDWDAAYEAVSRNFSADGVALLQEGLANTQRVLIGIQAENQLVYVPAEVRHCRTLTGNIVELGCRFQSQGEAARRGMTPDAASEIVPLRQVHQAIDDLLARQPAPPREDRRTGSRVTFNDRVELHLRSSKKPIIGYARDLSKGGIAFITIRPA